MNKPYTISDIKDGQYRVTIDLNEWMCPQQIYDFQANIRNIGREDPYFLSVCSMFGSILNYRSETLFPEKDDPDKKKILIILGNPATHSVANGMFFFSMRDGKNNGEKTHNFWNKLKIAGLINKIKCSTLEQEAIERKQLILRGQTSQDYLLGLTTFYSFPTPVKPRNKYKEKQKEQRKQYPAKLKYSDAAGVEKLFKAALPKLQKMEYDRLNSYEFAQGAIWIFTQVSSYRYVKSFSRIEYWPMTSMSGGSGGEDLKKILLIP